MINILCFEDIKRPGGDKDFNDAIFIVNVTDSSNLQNSASFFTNVTDYTTITSTAPAKSYNIIQQDDPVNSNMMLYTESGILTSFLASELLNYTGGADNIYTFKHVITTSSPEYAVYLKGFFDGTVFKLPVSITRSNATLIIIYSITKNQLDSNRVINNSGEEIQVQLMDPVDNYIGDEANDNLVSLQHFLFNDTEVTNHTFTLKNASNETVLTKNSVPVEVSLNVLMWGDPHLCTIHGKSYKLENIEGVFSLFENKTIKIRCECWKHPKFIEDHRFVLREATFIKKVGLRIDDETMVIDLDQWTVSHENSNKLTYLITDKQIAITMEQVLFCFDNKKEIDDVQNSVSINVKYLRRLNFLDKATGFFVSLSPNNYASHNTLV
jgi:hypothetical protein